ncbi:MAG: hypothetical protein RKU31_39485 [Deltaproteobacteria bacterium]
MRSAPARGILISDLRVRAALVLSLATFACGGDPDLIVADFSDELVEAAGRTAEISVISDQDCETLMAVRYEAVSDVATVIHRARTAYPIDPAIGVLDEVPRGQAIAIDLTVLDLDDNVVSRGCIETSLPAGSPATVEIEMMGLPVCDSDPRFIEIGIVLDASSHMQLANAALGNRVIDSLQSFLDLPAFPPNTSFSLLAHGPTEPTEIVAGTENTDAIKQGLDQFRTGNRGEVRTFETLILASSRLRTRAVCARRPAMLVISAGPDRGALGSFENAIIGIAGARGDTRDDLYTFGVALTQDARTDLDDLITDNSLGEVISAGTESAFDNALSQARFRFQGLVGP